MHYVSLYNFGEHISYHYYEEKESTEKTIDHFAVQYGCYGSSYWRCMYTVICPC